MSTLASPFWAMARVWHQSGLKGQLGAVRAASGEDGGAAAGRERDRLGKLVLARERKSQPGCKGIAAAVRVHDRARPSRGTKRSAGLRPAAEGPGRRDDEPWLEVEVACVVALPLVLAAADEHVDLDAGAPNRR